jgi:uncharacterized damage-inducible protein DinB
MTELNIADDPRYPIGKFTWTGPNTAEQRADYIAEIEAAPAKLMNCVRGLTDEQLNTPYRQDGWTVRQVVHHVADSHMNAYIRFKLALTENEPAIKGYDENAWALTADAKESPVESSLALLESLHKRWVVLLRAMTPQDFSRKLRHPEMGVVELDRYLALYAWHGKHHSAHISKLLERQGW